MNDALMALVFKYGAARCDVDRSNTAKNQRVCNEAIEAIRAALRDQPPSVPQGWRPIESAPKDGTEVILRRGNRVTAACWVQWPDTHDMDGALAHEGGEGWTIGLDGDRWDEPTHWQPLPSAPDATPSAPSSSQQGEADAARYRWLRDRGEYFSYQDGRPSPWTVIGTGFDDHHPCSGAELDAAIDAAASLESAKSGEVGNA